MDVFKRVMVEVVTSEDVRTPEGIENMLTTIRSDGASDTAVVRVVVVADEPTLEQIVFGAKDVIAARPCPSYGRAPSYAASVERACKDLGMPAIVG